MAYLSPVLHRPGVDCDYLIGAAMQWPLPLLSHSKRTIGNRPIIAVPAMLFATRKRTIVQCGR